MTPIDLFVQRYEHEYDFYDRLARLVAEQLDTRLRSDGIRAIVTGRAKRPDRLRAKLEKRGKNYKSEKEVRADIIDLAGVRAALYFPGDRERVSTAISEIFEEVRPVKRFPLESATSPSGTGWVKRFSGYAATHHLIRPRVKNLSGDFIRFASAAVEIQIGSVLMHAWAEVEHDLAYKPLSGTLSLDEQAILDELNGLVLAGEIALERLQRAGEARISSSRSPFADAYELAAHLAAHARAHLSKVLGDATLGRVDVLLKLLRQLKFDTPEGLAPYLAAVDPDVERRPLVDQLIDGIVAGDEARLAIYRSVRAPSESLGQTVQELATSYNETVGRFLRRWTVLESVLEHVLVPEKDRGKTTPTRIIHEAFKKGYLKREDLPHIEGARLIRNALLHRADVGLSPLELDRQSAFLEKLLQKLSQSDEPSLAGAAKSALFALASSPSSQR